MINEEREAQAQASEGRRGFFSLLKGVIAVKFTIKHEIKGRIRVHMEQRSHDLFTGGSSAFLSGKKQDGHQGKGI